jgi:hypothetical protein
MRPTAAVREEASVVGYQPGLVAGLSRHFGRDLVHVADLLEDSLGRSAHGIEIWEGATRTEELVDASQLVLATGTTAANGSLDEIVRLTQKSGIPLILYGVTAAAVCHLCGLRRLCLLAN